MRIGLIMDASCDLPQAYVDDHHITVLPIRIEVDGQTFSDRRDDAETRRFLDQDLGSRSHAARTEPYSADEIQALVLDELVTTCDCLFCLTITASRSPIHANAGKASFGVLKNYREVRDKAGLHGQFLMRVIDTQTLFAGAGVVVAEAVRLIEAGSAPADIRERLEQVARCAYGYMLPRDLHYLRARARKKGDRSVGLFGAALGSALDIKPILRGWQGRTEPVAKLRGFDHGALALFEHTANRIRDGLMVPTVCVSYGGALSDLRALPGYELISEACGESGVTLLESTMSITGMVNVGEGAITVGYACAEDDTDF